MCVCVCVFVCVCVCVCVWGGGGLIRNNRLLGYPFAGQEPNCSRLTSLVLTRVQRSDGAKNARRPYYSSNGDLKPGEIDPASAKFGQNIFNPKINSRGVEKISDYSLIFPRNSVLKTGLTSKIHPSACL